MVGLNGFTEHLFLGLQFVKSFAVGRADWQKVLAFKEDTQSYAVG